ncbi:efflux RND transporter periplasmic adaptor subunit [Colwellia sp. M166]|uniref:efflux RND transporter periplasmic adaptor subunit n=1 Tax=Colwellia sp. M166 TaxID=2583805 RepID=UPI00211E975A|nr:efflux RND transporter periplasmic adaptor subunit [Colwellia sp. M166]UUO23199.1 efflux RND transporter periplasmic adaptor subunit [Colwellia sp. M166]|tara:strand:- start:3206 stop:4261 length:1056 start_codon:yes stop_codon:yes gene_type:complete
MSAVSRRLPLLLLVTMLVALAVYLQWPKTTITQEKHQRVVSVKTVNIALADFKDAVEAIGTSRANEQVLITSKYSDLVDDISFQDGDTVSKGDILVRLNSQEEAAKVKELEANLAESVAQLNRFQDLFAKKATSKSLVDQQEAKTKAIAAQLLSAKIKLDDLTIKAPFSGILGFREISLGALVDVGDVITSLDDLSIIKVDFSIPERYLNTVAVGQRIEATNTAYQSQVFIGKVTSLDSRIDPVTRTLKVRAEISNADQKLRAGMLLNLQVVRKVEKVLQLPESAVIPIEDEHFVFVVEDGKAIKKSFQIGRRYLGFVEVLNGLDNNSEVVIEGALKLSDGTAVNVLGSKS